LCQVLNRAKTFVEKVRSGNKASKSFTAMYKKQIVVVVIVFAIMGYLFSQPVKGLIKPKETQGAC